MKWSLNLARRTDESICAAHIVDEDGISVAQLSLHDEATVLRNAEAICRGAWLPIDTAPRDGTPVDLWIVSAAPDVDHGMVDFYSPHARKVKGRPLREGRVPDVIWGHKPPNAPNWYPSGGLPGYPLAPDVKPTHWMPHPAPPLPNGDRNAG